MARRAEHRQAEPREELMGLRTTGYGWFAAAAVAAGCAGSALAAEPTPTSGGEAVFGLEADWHPV